MHFAFKKFFFGCPHQKDDSTSTSDTKKQKSYECDGDGEVHVFARPVLFSDLTEEDISVLERGFQQVLPQRDAAGRVVICFSGGPAVEQCFFSLVCLIIKIGEAPFNVLSCLFASEVEVLSPVYVCLQQKPGPCCILLHDDFTTRRRRPKKGNRLCGIQPGQNGHPTNV